MAGPICGFAAARLNLHRDTRVRGPLDLRAICVKGFTRASEDLSARRLSPWGRGEKLVLRASGESCCPSGVAVMKSANSRKGHDTAAARRLNGARYRRIALERHVRAVLVVVRDMSSHEAEQMTLAEDDDVVQ